MASRQGRHASPWRHRKGLCRTMQGWRHHAERDSSRTEANRRCAAAASSPHPPRPKLRQLPRRKEARRRQRLQHRFPAPAQQPPLPEQRRWKPGSSRTKLPQKFAVRPILSCGSICRRRSITLRERGVTAPRSVARTCARRKRLQLKIGPRKPRSIPETKLSTLSAGLATIFYPRA